MAVRRSPAPWLLASIATFGLVAGAMWFGGSVAARAFQDVAARELVSGGALIELEGGVSELQTGLADALAGTGTMTAADAEDMVDALDRAFARYLASRVPADERQRGDHVYELYRAWRAEHVIPAIASLRGAGPLGEPTVERSWRLEGRRENPGDGGALTMLAVSTGGRQRETMQSAAVTYNRTNAVLSTLGLLGIMGGLAAGFVAVARDAHYRDDADPFGFAEDAEAFFAGMPAGSSSSAPAAGGLAARPE